MIGKFPPPHPMNLLHQTSGSTLNSERQTEATSSVFGWVGDGGEQTQKITPLSPQKTQTKTETHSHSHAYLSGKVQAVSVDPVVFPGQKA